MIVDPLSRYLRLLTTLNVSRSRGMPAPHKPILLLSIIDGIEKGEITENKIRITPELVARFRDYFTELTVDDRFVANFALPFWHLQGRADGTRFWHLHMKPGKEIILTSSGSIKSLAQLIDVVDYASLDDTLFWLIRNSATRDAMRQVLLHRWFPHYAHTGLHEHLYDSLLQQVLNNRQNPNTLPPDEEVRFIRGGIFRKMVPRIYDFTCCISGFKVIAPQDVQMVDACHIIPFAESGDDNIANGISLCPNLHRAFDRGLITIDPDYRVLAKDFSDLGTYGLKDFVGHRIRTPQDPVHWPSQDRLQTHRVRFGFV